MWTNQHMTTHISIHKHTNASFQNVKRCMFTGLRFLDKSALDFFNAFYSIIYWNASSGSIMDFIPCNNVWQFMCKSYPSISFKTVSSLSLIFLWTVSLKLLTSATSEEISIFCSCESNSRSSFSFCISCNFSLIVLSVACCWLVHNMISSFIFCTCVSRSVIKCTEALISNIFDSSIACSSWNCLRNFSWSAVLACGSSSRVWSRCLPIAVTHLVHRPTRQSMHISVHSLSGWAEQGKPAGFIFCLRLSMTSSIARLVGNSGRLKSVPVSTLWHFWNKSLCLLLHTGHVISLKFCRARANRQVWQNVCPHRRSLGTWIPLSYCSMHTVQLVQSCRSLVCCEVAMLKQNDWES